jgi:hypothetical protein
VSLIDKESSTAVVRAGSDTVAVFTERMFSVKTGEYIEVMKPAGFLSVYKALHPNEVFCENFRNPGDFINHINYVRNKAPEFFPILDIPDDLKIKKSYRTTVFRQLIINKLMEHEEGTETISMDQKSLQSLATAVERFLLISYPSTKGQPMHITPEISRVDISKALSRDLLVSLRRLIRERTMC